MASIQGTRRPKAIQGVRRRGIALHAVLVIGLLLSAFPFYWAIIMSTHTSTEIFSYPPKLLPGSHFLENARSLFDNIDFFGSMFNSLLVACAVTFLVLFFDSLAAFVFAKFDFPGRRLLFVVLMAIFMVPTQMAIIPQFVIMAKIGWIGSMTALIVPAAANAFGIFWMRRTCRARSTTNCWTPRRSTGRTSCASTGTSPCRSSARVSPSSASSPSWPSGTTTPGP
jgi:cellobiose transport system permease protein